VSSAGCDLTVKWLRLVNGEMKWLWQRTRRLIRGPNKLIITNQPIKPSHVSKQLIPDKISGNTLSLYTSKDKTSL
jgi:hypothetical protein